MLLINQKSYLISCSAANAESAPLLPNFPPDLSSDWLIFKSVETQKINGASYLILRSFTPSATAWEINSKWGVSPFIKHPNAINPSYSFIYLEIKSQDWILINRKFFIV